MRLLQRTGNLLVGGETLRVAAMLFAAFSSLGTVLGQGRIAQDYPQPPIVVAIAGAINGTPAAYELPAGSTVADALNRVGGPLAYSSGRFRLFRGSLFEDTEGSLPLVDGDTIYFLSSRPTQVEHPTIVLTAPGVRPLVLSVPAYDATFESIKSKLPEHLAAASTILNSRSVAPLDDGAIVAVNRVDAAYWARMASALPAVPYQASAPYQQPKAVASAPKPVEVTSLPAPPAQVTANAPVAISPAPPQAATAMDIEPSTPMLPTVLPRTAEATLPDNHLMNAPVEQPTLAPERVLVPVLPKLRPANSQLADLALPNLPSMPTPDRPRVISVEPIPVATSTVTQNKPARPEIVVSERSQTSVREIQPISSPPTLAGPKAVAGQPNPFAPAESASAIDSVATESRVGSKGSFVMVGLSAAVALIIGTVYLVLQSLGGGGEGFDVADDIEAEATHNVDDLPLMRENAPIEMPMSIVGRTVALGHIRIDAAHEQPSGPHFATAGSKSTNRRQQTAAAGSSISESDVFGRALAAMERERTR